MKGAHESHLLGCLATMAALSFLVFASLGGAAYALWRSEGGHASIESVEYRGDARRGPSLVARYGCESCHVIAHAGVAGAAGPPLSGMGRRSYIAGRFPNREVWMTRWLQHPQEMKPGTAMPEMNVNDRDALDLAAYLATLR